MTENQKTHLLVVDDEPEMREELFSFFADEGYRVTAVSSGNEGMEASLADPVDAVITDIRMPRGNGRELIDHLQSNWPDLPILVLTGHGAFDRKGVYQEKTSITVIRKPAGLREISRTLEQMLGRG